MHKDLDKIWIDRKKGIEMHKDLSKIWMDLKWSFRMLIRNGDFRESDYGFDIFEKASGELDLTPDYGKVKISIEYKGPDKNYRNVIYEIEMKHPSYDEKSFEIKVPEEEIFVDDPLEQSGAIADAAEHQMAEYLDFVFRSANESSDYRSIPTKDLEKDLLKGEFSAKVPQMLLYGKGKFLGFDVFAELDEIRYGEEEWPEKNLEIIYNYKISGKGFKDKGKFAEIIKPEDTKEFMANDIAKFFRFILFRNRIID